MTKLILTLFFFSVFFYSSIAQQVIPLYDGKVPGNNGDAPEEVIKYSDSGEISMISNVTEPSITVYLPDPEIATGTAVILCPGGGMRVLAWENDVIKMSKFLNEKGIAAIGLKYRLFTGEMHPPKGGMPFSYSVTEFDKYIKANANPMPGKESSEGVMRAGADALEAVRIVRENAGAWKINPEKIGLLGFSAGGGVATAAVVQSSDEGFMPDFIASIYGPSLIDVELPENTPPIFICSNIEHNNVAAGCLALFLEWEKAGFPAEIHLYGTGKGVFGIDEQGQTSDTWSGNFIKWLSVSGF